MSTAVGRTAEESAARFLQSQGFTVLQRNWRTRWCEIDIVAQKGGRVYFVEVKYRSTVRQGSGLAYITAAKLRQMNFAAEFWLSRYSRPGIEYALAAVEVGGPDFEVTEWLEDIQM